MNEWRDKFSEQELLIYDFLKDHRHESFEQLMR